LSRSTRLGDLELDFSGGWNEKTDRVKGRFEIKWGVANSWEEVILQGPHLFIGNPFYKAPNATMLHKLDWSSVDLEMLAPDAIPITSYKPAGDRATYDASFTRWGPDKQPARNFYRVGWRAMAANVGERTLIAAVYPPGTAHVHSVSMLAAKSGLDGTLLIAGLLNSLPLDFLVRAAPKSAITSATVMRLPRIDQRLAREVVARTLCLEALTSAYTLAWSNSWSSMIADWAGGIEYPGRLGLLDRSSEWNSQAPLRRASDRRQALVEIDALVALALSLSVDELCAIYRTQFPVLYGFDNNVYFYDANGRLVPNEVLKVWRHKQDAISEQERTATNASGNTYTYELPFRTLDREADMRQAYAHFEQLLKDEE